MAGKMQPGTLPGQKPGRYRFLFCGCSHFCADGLPAVPRRPQTAPADIRTAEQEQAMLDMEAGVVSAGDFLGTGDHEKPERSISQRSGLQGPGCAHLRVFPRPRIENGRSLSK